MSNHRKSQRHARRRKAKRRERGVTDVVFLMALAALILSILCAIGYLPR